MKALVGHRYKHYKGNEYVVLALAYHSETCEELVVYEAQYNSEDFGDNAVWVRPLEMFEEQIKISGIMTDRFTKCD